MRGVMPEGCPSSLTSRRSSRVHYPVLSLAALPDDRRRRPRAAISVVPLQSGYLMHPKKEPFLPFRRSVFPLHSGQGGPCFEILSVESADVRRRPCLASSFRLTLHPHSSSQWKNGPNLPSLKTVREPQSSHLGFSASPTVCNALSVDTRRFDIFAAMASARPAFTTRVMLSSVR